MDGFIGKDFIRQPMDQRNRTNQIDQMNKINQTNRINAIVGFTLLEVVIALAILSVVAVAFLRAQASSLRLIDESNQISMATLLAKEKMAELESAGFPESGRNSGTGGEAFSQFRWEQVVSPTEIMDLRKVLVRVFWMEGTQERSLELTAYFAKR